MTGDTVQGSAKWSPRRQSSPIPLVCAKCSKQLAYTGTPLSYARYRKLCIKLHKHHTCIRIIPSSWCRNWSWLDSWTAGSPLAWLASRWTVWSDRRTDRRNSRSRDLADRGFPEITAFVCLEFCKEYCLEMEVPSAVGESIRKSTNVWTMETLKHIMHE